MAKEYFNPFYIFNILLCLVYPIIRNYGESLWLNITDSWGFKRETQIITGILTILTLRYVQHYSSFKKFLHEVFFYFKSGVAMMTLLTDYRLFCWYLFGCLIVWLLFSPPRYQGASSVQFISNEIAFNEVVLAESKKGKDNAWLVVFYSNYSNDCIYTEELFARISLKYKTQSLNFGKVDVDANQSIAHRYNIRTSGYKIYLPFVIMFMNGKEEGRYPSNDKEAKHYREKEIVKRFNLEEIYQTTQ